MNWKIPLFDIDISEAEISAVSDVLKSGWLTLGEVTKKFETEFAQMVNCKHAFCVNNGTAALHLALVAAGIGPGDEVIVPSLTFVATTNSILYTGATPVWADVIGYDDFNISPDRIREKITSKTKGILVVHYAGYPCQMREICEIAKEFDLKVFEDAAHAPGAQIDGKFCGTFGAAGCFSFFSNKNMTMGEGGLITTNNDQVAENLRVMRSHGMTSLTLDRFKGHNYSYDVVALGYNYRPTEVQSAIGRVQLKKLPEYNARRTELTKYYHEKLADVPGLSVPFKNHPGTPSFHVMPILLAKGVDRLAFMGYLKNAGIQTSIHYPPTHLFTYHQNMHDSLREDLPLTTDIAQREVTLPLYPKMTYSDIDFVVQEILQFMKENFKR
ncbi:DegT/DnrJ/EryC1/StrS family aminotransferase [candidate division KSB1 bacterium]|nr:DegT/DnrJ/EryC1/StrS family aminotransferase [candidate division KSB1 bacterium]